MDDRRSPKEAEQGGAGAAQAGATLNSCAEITWMITAAAQKRLNGAGLALPRQAEHETHVP